MEGKKKSPRKVHRTFEVSRLEEELLANAYQQAVPPIRGLVGPSKPPCQNNPPKTQSTQKAKGVR